MRRALALAVAFALAACTGDDDDDAFSGDTEVSGTVESITTGGEVPLEGAVVEALDGGPSTTTDVNGAWSLSLASNSTLTLRASADEHWAAQIAMVVPPSGTNLNYGIPQDAVVNAIGSLLGFGAPDETKALVAVDFFGIAVNTAGYAATLSAANGGSFTFNSNGDPVLSHKTLPNGDTTLIFVNVEPGTYTVTVTTSGALTCTNPFSVTTQPADEKTLTLSPQFCQ